MKKSDSRIAIAVILLFAVLLIALGFIAFTPHTKNFTYICEARAIEDNNVYISGSEPDCDEELEELDDEATSLTVHPIGLRWYRTDNSGIWTRELTVVYEVED